MPALIEGYNYDIFISYRQKDNKGDKWVSEFVKALKTELESTFKEEISVYFDNNTHDGLLETYDVDESLREKLKCLVFIPVISRTYCDPKSFAWDNEFKSFINQASRDRFGLKVRLLNGNVASRVLPVQIHDLNAEDKSLLEHELTGVLRAIEFIYKEPGVNRPLTPGDDENKNINKTKYRNQINKIANATDELFGSLMAVHAIPAGNENNQKLSEDLNPWKKQNKEKRLSYREKPLKISKLKPWPLLILIALFLVIASVLAYPRLFKSNTLEKLRSSGERISVAVMPFQNVTNDSTLNIWQDGIQFNLISSLSNSQSLKVVQTQSTNDLLKSKGFTNYALITPSDARTVSQNLEAKIFIFGNLNQSFGKIRISAQLIDSKTLEIFKSFYLDGKLNRILQLTDSLSLLIKNYLIISSMKKEISNEFQADVPSSVEAFKSYILGYKAFADYDFQSAVKWFLQSIKIDTVYATSYVWLSISYANQGEYDQAEKWARIVNGKKDQLSFEMKIWVNWVCAKYVEKSKTEEIKYAKQLLELDDRVPITHWLVGLPYYEMNQYNNAIPELESTLRIYKSWNAKPLNGSFYEVLIACYHKTGRYREEKELLKQALADFPGDRSIIRRQIIFSLAEKDTVTSNQYIKKTVALSRGMSKSDADIADDLAAIYQEAGLTDRAEKYFREAVSLEPGNVQKLNDLAFLLIDKGINVKEGMDINNKAIKASHSDQWYLEDTKGWGLYKTGRKKEALEILEKCWDKRPDYRHQLYLHLEEVKKAVAVEIKN